MQSVARKRRVRTSTARYVFEAVELKQALRRLHVACSDGVASDLQEIVTSDERRGRLGRSPVRVKRRSDPGLARKRQRWDGTRTNAGENDRGRSNFGKSFRVASD